MPLNQNACRSLMRLNSNKVDDILKTEIVEQQKRAQTGSPLGRLERQLKGMTKQKEKKERQGQTVDERVLKKIQETQNQIDKLKASGNTGGNGSPLVAPMQRLVESGNTQAMLNFIRQNNTEQDYYTLKNYPSSARAIIWLDRDISDQYDYGSNKLSVSKAKKYYKTFPNSITTADKHTSVFLAATLSEPSRYSTAHITNMLLQGSKLKGNNVFEHTSMTQTGSDPTGEIAKNKNLTADPRLQGEKNIQNVTDRDLAAVKQHNPQLYKKLKDVFEQNAKKSDGTIIAELTKIIEKHLKLKEGPLAQLLNKLLGR